MSLLLLFLLGCLGLTSARHPAYLPDNWKTAAYDGDQEEDNSKRLPDVISITEYRLKIQPYYPAPGIQYDKKRNLTFDGTVEMSVLIKKPTTEITLNAANLNISSVELSDFLHREVKIKSKSVDERKEFLTIVLEKQPTVGSLLILKIMYTGLINYYNDGGLYYTTHQQPNGETLWMIATQLAVYWARTVFPCMDEPAYKAVYRLDLIYPSSHVALANMKETAAVDLRNGWSKISFPATPIMSTYLVAFAVGPFVSHDVINRDGTLVRSWGWTGQENFLQFSAETAAECLYQMGQYTNIKFPLEKCDNLGLPEFLAGAMENFGLIVYKSEIIALNPDTITTIEKIESAYIICHEVAHQWFGNLVTTHWWDDLFLNEGTATYFSKIMMAAAFPKEASYVDAVTVRRDREKALRADAGAFVHPLVAPDGPYFDLITYEKGGILFRMLSDVMGSEVLRNGFQRYLRTHQYSTASHRDLFSSLTEATEEAGVYGWCGLLNVTHFMDSYVHQTGFPLINVSVDEDGLNLSQEPFTEKTNEIPSMWNNEWIVPVRTAGYDSPKRRIHWVAPGKETNECYERSVNKWHIVSYASATYGRVFYDDDSLKSLLKKMRTDDVPVGVKIALIGDELAFIQRLQKKNQPYSYDRLLNILTTVLNTPSKEEPSAELVDVVVQQLEFFANLLRDSIDEPLVNRLISKAIGKIYSEEIWEAPSTWNMDVLKDVFLPYAVKYDLGDSRKKAGEIFSKIFENCNTAQNGSSWCSNVQNDVHRAAYCGAAKNDVKLGTNFEYYALLEGMACTERPVQLKKLIKMALISEVDYPMVFRWLKTNPAASEALLLYLNSKPEQVLNFDGLRLYLDAMTYGWKSKARLQQFINLEESLLPKISEKNKVVFDEIRKRIKKDVEWSEKYLPSITKWMYDNLVIVKKGPWKKRLPGIIVPTRYDLEITPYIPGSAKYLFSRNMTFDGKVTMTFTVTQETSEIVVNAHRLVIDPGNIVVKDNQNTNIEVNTAEVEKDYENGILTIPLASKLTPNTVYFLSISYSGFISNKQHHGVYSNYNFQEYRGKQGWIFSTDFEGTPGSRSLMISCDEPSYKAIFNISVHHSADMTVLSNMLDKGTTLTKDGWAVTKFRETPKMSSHMVAICVGHFSSISSISNTGVIVRAFSWTGMEVYADFSLEIMAGTVDYLSNYFNYKFPLKKLDLLALPYFPIRDESANWGLILANYKNLLTDMDYAEPKTLRKVALTVAHEVVHQWFGNMLTIKWWSDIFLTEGLAGYFASHAVNSVVTPKHRGYIIDHYQFESTSIALKDDCKRRSARPLISDEGLFTTKVMKKGNALINLLSNTIPEKTFQKGIRNFIAKNANGNPAPEDLWNSLSEACAEDHIDGWDKQDLNVSELMKAWTTEISFPILKVSTSKEGRVTYRQESCLGGDTTWNIPVYSGTAGKDLQQLNWFIGKDGTSPVWTQNSPLTRLDNVRGSSFIRMYYDTNTMESLLDSARITRAAVTQGTILSDAWFFVSKGNYTWPQFLDIAHAIRLDHDLIPWSVREEYFEKLYHYFRFHKEFPKVENYLISSAKGLSNRVGYPITIASIDRNAPWDQRTFVAHLNEWMCRLNDRQCLEKANTEFNEFLVTCAYSNYGTAHCSPVNPEFRRTMYCYGIRQNPKAENILYSLYEDITKNELYFDRDADNLLYSLSCQNNEKELKKYIQKALIGELPKEILSYIAMNDNTGTVLFNYFVNNVDKILSSDVEFSYYINAMTSDWSSENQQTELMYFQDEEIYESLNKEQQQSWELAVQKVNETLTWFHTNAPGILDWIDKHREK
ncbi:hypothetical protein RB195_021310 [Necator americanus]|uniref:Peptidase family M1 n=1 Tax=Necator americanus TaxID=51031 RepID=A0ABR1EAI2_NECAM